MSADAFQRLNPAIQYHVVNSLGWKMLRPAQLAAIDPILSGKSCLVLAPTAGGKTEAAIIPILSRMVTEDWRGLTVLYVCPIKALLNNLEERLSRYAALIGRAVQVWHGDVSQNAKTRALRDAPDILLTTPESLEGMLISLRVDRQSWFGALRVAIVDELHAFAGDDRGWHVRAVLGRLQEFAHEPIQRIGLSATLGNPDELLRWFTSGHDGVVVGESATSADADVTIDYVGTLVNAATVISRLHRGAKRLVFCDSRARVEELAAKLRELGTRTFVSHSSLSASERRQAEQAFAEDKDCVIVATSTLELGIDVGDLDYVVQIDAPTTVSSFLQRMGRTGRRVGSRRNCLFLTTSDEALLIAAGIARLWKEGFVEPIVPPPEPWQLAAQQAMALVLQSNGIGLSECERKVAALFPELPASGIKEILVHMCATDILSEQDGLLAFGIRGEKLYGRQNFLELLSSFASPLQFLVRHGSSELGYVDPVCLRGENDAAAALLLAGHSWHVVSVDWSRRTIWVEPAREEGKARWFGSSRSLGFALCQGVRGVLCDGIPDVILSKRAGAKLASIREDLPNFGLDAVVFEHVGDGRTRWWTFGGGKANGPLGAALRRKYKRVRIDDFYVEIGGTLSASDARDLWAEYDALGFAQQLVAERAMDLKFSEALPIAKLAAIALSRTVDMAGARQVLGAN